MSAHFPDGEGIFETIKTLDGLPFALSRHIARATRSARKLNLPIPSESDIRQAISWQLAESAISTEVGRLRVSFSTSGEIYLLHENYVRWTHPARLTILDIPVEENALLVGVKALPYVQNIALLELAQTKL